MCNLLQTSVDSDHPGRGSKPSIALESKPSNQLATVLHSTSIRYVDLISQYSTALYRGILLIPLLVSRCIQMSECCVVLLYGSICYCIVIRCIIKFLDISLQVS